MANVSRVNGFRPVKHLNGSPWNGQVNKYSTTTGDSQAIYIGDLVTLQGSAALDGTIMVEQADANDVCVGVVVFCEPNPDNLMQVHRLASTERIVYVADSPDIIMEAQANAAVQADSLGLNVNFVATAGSATTGQSGMVVGASTADTTNTLPLAYVGFSTRADNETGTAVGTGATAVKVLVAWNTHQYKGSTGATGI
jgi:hypothetical protein